MTERWPKVLNIALALVLIFAITAYVLQGIEYGTLRTYHEKTLQTLQHQTQLIADLRLELVESKTRYRNFENEQALRDWVNRWMLTRMPIALEFFGTDIILRGEKYSMYFDCDDLTEAIQRDALYDGYLLSKALVDREGCVYGVNVTDFKEHTGAVAVAGNAYWYIEPQTGQIAYIVRKD